MISVLSGGVVLFDKYRDINEILALSLPMVAILLSIFLAWFIYLLERNYLIFIKGIYNKHVRVDDMVKSSVRN